VYEAVKVSLEDGSESRMKCQSSSLLLSAFGSIPSRFDSASGSDAGKHVRKVTISVVL